MAQPPEVTRSLATISTRHAVFEPDQVLTHGQLNGITDYLDDQQRLTRVLLLGVGIVDGLRLSRSGNRVTVAKGFGISTDGDLLMLAGNAVYDRFKPYDEKAPKYPPFYDGNSMRKVYELIREGESDTLARPLANLPAPGLDNMVAVLFMESHEVDQDLCSGTDCDNLGRDAVNTQRLLLIARADAGALQSTLAPPTQGAAKLARLSSVRAALDNGVKTVGDLADRYRKACNKTHADLLAAINGGGTWLAGLAGANPASGWTTALNKINQTFNADARAIQYYHAFLKDLAATWNALRDALIDYDCVPFPDIAAFPKHLLLGDLANPAQLRTGLYPSPLTGDRRRLEEGVFLLARLHVLIHAFRRPDGLDEIRVTPSRVETQPLEARAIPCYYAPDAGLPVLRSWNWRLERRGDSGRLLGYFAAELGADAAARRPLEFSLGEYDFFRVEGHLGQPVGRVVEQLQRQRREANLPFTVRAVLLHNDRGRLTIRPDRRYGDLHRLHALLRRDVAATLDDGRKLGTAMHGKVNDAVKNGSVPAQMENRTTVDLSDGLRKDVEAAADKTAPVLASKSYSAYRQEVNKTGSTWVADYRAAVDAASRYKSAFGTVLRTDHSTAFDTLVADSRVRWLDWLDVLIKDRNDRADDRLLFPAFIAEHPGAAHGGGTPRGGTLVLAYDDKGSVVADFMLPYLWEDGDEVEPDNEPELTVPPYKAPDFHQFGFQFVKPLDLRFNQELLAFEAQLKPKWQAEIDMQERYFGYLQGSLQIFEQAGRSVTVPGVTGVVGTFDDRLAGYYADSIAKASQQYQTLKDLAQDPQTPDAVRERARREMTAAELTVAEAIGAASHYVATAKVDIAAGSDGEKLLKNVSQGAGLVSSQKARERAGAGLKEAQAAAQGAQKTAIGQIALINNLNF